MNNCCQNLYFLSTIACKLAECMSEEELAKLSADLVVLSDMLANILACQNITHSVSSTTDQTVDSLL